MRAPTSSLQTIIMVLHLLLHASCPGKCDNTTKACSNERYSYLRQGIPTCERCTQRCSAENNQVEVTSCTLQQNRVCHCKPGFFCKKENNYNTYCHKPCVPCGNGTFSSVPSLNPSCTPHTDCAKSGKTVQKEGTDTQDRECGHVVKTPTKLPTPSKMIVGLPPTTATTPSPSNTDTTTKAMTLHLIHTSTSLPSSHSSTEATPTQLHSRSATGTTSAKPAQGGNMQLKHSDRMSPNHLILLMLLMILLLVVAVFCILRKSTALKSLHKWTGFISGKHQKNTLLQVWNNQRLSKVSMNEQVWGMELPHCSEVKGQSTDMTSHSGSGQRVSMEHNVKGENVSNTVGSIYIYSPGMVILGSNSGDKKEDAEVCDEDVALISPPQQESSPPSQEFRIRMSAQEEEPTLSFPVPATGK